jgi:prepilin-type N-terminal cleavage/methylation domain-containing protein
MMIQPVSRPSIRRLRPAFTLVEVLVVMVILVIIAGAATTAVFSQLEKAKRQEVKLKMQKIETAAKMYFTLYSEYPQDASVLTATSPDGSAPLLEGGTTAITDPWGQQMQISVTQDNQGSTRILVTSNGSGSALTWPEK